MSHDNSTDINTQFDCPPIQGTFADSQRHRLSFRNERTLYQRTCDATGKPIISIYAPDSPLTVYKSDYWYSDAWDAMNYGRDFDFTRPFFEQVAELARVVPRIALINVKGENSDYCNMTYGNKNCYLLFGGDFNEDCMYGTLGMYNRTTLDADYSNRNELCYELSDSLNCYSCQFTFDSRNCSNCYYISDCVGSSDCILSTNLINKQYYIENQPYSQEEYEAKKRELLSGGQADRAAIYKRFLKLRAERPVKYSHQQSCTDSTGDYLKNSKNCLNCFDVSDSEDCQDVFFAIKAKDCHECTLVGHDAEVAYNTLSVMGSYRVMGSVFTIDSSNIEYCMNTLNGKNLFGCVGTRGKQYCILNQQYTEQAFSAMRAKLVDHMKSTGEWGQFFPPTLSDFAYNESSAKSYFPCTKDEAIAQGFRWRDDASTTSKPPTLEVPDSIDDVSDTIINEILRCRQCQRNYKIMPQELSFYQTSSLPIPDVCSDCRHQRRLSLRNPRQLWTRQCAECGQTIQTTYAPDRPERVLCEDCFQKEVY